MTGYDSDRDLFTAAGDKLVAEASTLGWRPGFFPVLLKVGDALYRRHRPVLDASGDVAAVVYLGDGPAVHVLND